MYIYFSLYNPFFKLYSQSYALPLITKHFHHPKKKAHDYLAATPDSPLPPGPRNHELTFCLYGFHINGITEYVLLILSRFIHVVAKISSSLLFMAE